MITERDGSYELMLSGFSVVYCRVDYAFTLELADALGFAPFPGVNRVSIRIGGKFLIETNGVVVSFDPAGPAAGLGPALELGRERSVAQAIIRRTGDLVLTFNEGTVLTVPPDEKYEAWELSGPGGLLVVCVPGGSLAIWSASP